MAYIDVDSLDEYLSENVLIQLTDDDQTKTVNSDVVDECIAGAEGEIDGLLAGLYSVPFSSAPDLIVEIDVVLTVYRLYLRRGRVPENFLELVKEKKDILMKVATGKIALPGQSENAETTGMPAITGNDRIFGRANSEGW